MNTATAAVETTTTHPLEPLSADEIAAAAAILRDALGLDENARFVFIMLHEPPKEAIHSWEPGASVPREAEVIVRERGRMGVLEAIVSLTEGKVVRSERRTGVQAPISEEEFMAAEEVVGHEVRWQKWRLRIGFNAKEGLTLHEVGYEDRGRVRPIVHRASLSEMFVPYGDPAPTHINKNVFDMGEYGIGWLANSLTLGCDCLGEIHYFDGVVNDQDGNPRTIENAICTHEEDTGISWKHTDFRTEEVEVRRARRLVISMIATVGNYEYGYFWYLNTDGTIEYEVKLTGVISTGALPPGQKPAHGVLVSPGLYGMHHQHFFCVRLDMEVDGEQNRVVEVDSEPIPMGPDNPTGTVWVTKK